jgi:hypothetical protein
MCDSHSEEQKCFCSTNMGVSTEIYHTKIGRFVVKYKEMYMIIKSEDWTESKIWFLRLLVLVVTDGMRMNPDPQVKHVKTEEFYIYGKWWFHKIELMMADKQIKIWKFGKQIESENWQIGLAKNLTKSTREYYE